MALMESFRKVVRFVLSLEIGDHFAISISTAKKVAISIYSIDVVRRRVAFLSSRTGRGYD